MKVSFLNFYYSFVHPKLLCQIFVHSWPSMPDFCFILNFCLQFVPSQTSVPDVVSLNFYAQFCFHPNLLYLDFVPSLASPMPAFVSVLIFYASSFPSLFYVISFLPKLLCQILFHPKLLCQILFHPKLLCQISFHLKLLCQIFVPPKLLCQFVPS
jgi:hypothetical protein